jgi:hypothetical protein
MRESTLSFNGLAEQLWQYRLMLHNPGPISSTPRCVVIRGLDGDYALAAVHRDGDRLIFDLGRKFEE